MKKKNGFTLAELMIVLAILGVIAAILTPVIFDAMPDENKLKFKKAYYTLQRTTDAVLNSDVYPEGDMSKGGNNPARTFCNAFSDMLNTIYDNCAGTGALKANNGAAFTYNPDNATASITTLDTYCSSAVVANPLDGGSSNFPKFITQDGIFWWGFDYGFGTSTDNDGIRTDYSIICIDVDGPGSETPFAFAVRNDGKVVMGKKARDWLKEGVKSSVQTEN